MKLRQRTAVAGRVINGTGFAQPACVMMNKVFSKHVKILATGTALGVALYAVQSRAADRKDNPFNGATYMNVNLHAGQDQGGLPQKYVAYPKGSLPAALRDATDDSPERMAERMELSAVISKTPKAPDLNAPGGPKIMEVLETADSPDNYFTWASHMAQMVGPTDDGNPHADPGDGPWKKFYFPLDTGEGAGRVGQKSGVAVLRFKNGCQINVMEGGNLFVGRYNGMWFGTGATCNLTSGVQLSSGAYYTFKTDNTEAYTFDRKKGVGVGIRILF